MNALKAIQDNCGLVTYNLGTGKGEKAERELGWRAEYGINEMVRDSWNWQKRNIRMGLNNSLLKINGTRHSGEGVPCFVSS